MFLATWNLNNRVGKVRFRPEAANAAVTLGADVIVFTEYFPQHHHQHFCDVLAESGWTYQLLSMPTGETANRVLIVSRLPLNRGSLSLPDFDNQFSANIVSAYLPTLDLIVLGLRIPAYGSKNRAQLTLSWEWLEATAMSLREKPAIIVGDLNVQAVSSNGKGGGYFQRMQNSGWERAKTNGGFSFFGIKARAPKLTTFLLLSIV